MPESWGALIAAHVVPGNLALHQLRPVSPRELRYWGAFHLQADVRCAGVALSSAWEVQRLL